MTLPAQLPQGQHSTEQQKSKTHLARIPHNALNPPTPIPPPERRRTLKNTPVPPAPRRRHLAEPPPSSAFIPAARIVICATARPVLVVRRRAAAAAAAGGGARTGRVRARSFRVRVDRHDAVLVMPVAGPGPVVAAARYRLVRDVSRRRRLLEGGYCLGDDAANVRLGHGWHLGVARGSRMKMESSRGRKTCIASRENMHSIKRR